VDLRLLGPVEAHVEGSPLALGGPRQRAVLAALLLKGNRPVPAERLVRAVWETPPASAHANIRTYVAGLRRVFRDVGQPNRISSHGSEYRFAVKPEELDVARFSSLAEQGGRALSAGDFETAARHFGEALGLWRGRPLSGAALGPYLETEAALLEERWLAVVEQAVDGELALGRHRELIAELRELVAEHPARERFWAQLMLALYRSDRQTDALAAYTQLRGRLADELGLDPSPELQRLHAQLLRADPALADPPPGRGAAGTSASHVPPPRQLPPSIGTFTGRADELIRLIELLRSAGAGPVVISAIDGAGGIGKSALAVQAAFRLTEQFPDGQLYVDLQGATEGLSALDPGAALAWFLRSLGVDNARIPTDLDEMSAAFRSEVSAQRLLIVLDNAADADQVRPLLPSGPGCAVVITSRRVLATLDGAAHIHLDVLPLDEAVTLLERLIGPARVAAEYQAAVEIADLCGRLPLALRIAGARLAARPRWSLGAFAGRLSDAQTRLDQLETADLTVRASFRISYESLQNSDDPVNQTAARAFRLIGVLDGPDLSIPVVAALLDRPVPVAEQVMERLADARLVETTDVGRYRFHDLIRLFARELAAAAEPEEMTLCAFERVMACHLATAQRAVRLLDPLRQWPVHPVEERFRVEIRDRAAADAWLEAERVNLVASVVQATNRSDPVARLGIGLAGALLWFLFPRLYVHDLHTTGEAVISAARRIADPAGEAWGLEMRGFVRYQRGQYAASMTAVKSANSIWRRLGNRDGEQRTLCNLANALHASGGQVEAITLSNRQISLANAIGNRVAELIGLINLGDCYQELGDLGAALGHLHKALAIAEEINDARSLGRIYFSLGLVYVERRKFSDARAFLEDALSYMRDMHDREGEAEILISLSRTCRMLRDFEAAARYCERGLALRREAGNRNAELEALREHDRLAQALSGSGHPNLG
jgi:DNA-binding SARP family transcriptional activator